MKKINKLLIVWMLTGMHVNPIWATAPKSKCDKVLSACDKAVNDLVAASDAKNLVVRDLTNQNVILKGELDDAISSKNAWYRNPYLLVTVGVLAGIWAAKK